MKRIDQTSDSQQGVLAEQQNAFANEGAPPPGVVGTDLTWRADVVAADRNEHSAHSPEGPPQPRRPRRG